MKNIKLIFFLVTITISFTSSVQGQGDFFDPQPDNFMKQLKIIFKENSRSELDKVYNDLSSQYKSGKMSEPQLGKMVDVLNQMHKLRMRPYPHYSGFISAVTAASKSGYDDEFLDKWYLFLKGIIKNAKIGKTKDFRKFVDFSNDLFEYNALVADRSKSYTIDTKDLDFEYRNGDFFVKVPLTTIRGFFKSDTTFIHETAGEFNIMKKLWYGKMGAIKWDKLEGNNFATIGAYQIDMSKPYYSIDSAKLTFPEYFPEPVMGKVSDKINKKNTDENHDYPRFSTYKKDFKFFNTLAPNVKVSGGFDIKGDKVVIASEDGEAVTIEIYNLANTKKLFDAQGSLCVFEKGKFVKMQKSRVKLYVQDDTISHAFCDFDYKIPQNKLIVLKEESGAGKARFRSTLLKMSFDTEMIEWDLDSNFMDLLVLSGKGVAAAKFISHNNFDRETYNLARTAAGNTNPLNLLSKYHERNPDGISLNTFVSAFGPSFSPSSVLPMVFILEKEGFLRYDQFAKKLYPNKEYVDFYLKANKKESDFDIIRFNGYGEKYIGRLYTDNKKLLVNRVKNVPLNDSSGVYLYPYKGSQVEVTGNRHLKMEGKLMLGRLDLFGKEYHLDYDSFMVSSDFIERMDIYVPKKEETYIRDEKLVPLMSSLENLKAKMYINARFNKSGNVQANKYPKLHSIDNSYVNYDHQNIYGGIYKRDKFYFEVDPFKKDSMRTFNKGNLFFDGKLFSHDIFEPFKETLRIQPDRSLGFISETPAEGYMTYGGNGTFNGKIKLSNRGLIGDGNLGYQTAHLESDSILYFPESTSLMAKKFKMDKQDAGVQFPKIESDSSYVEWKPYSDTMLIANKSSKPFRMYDDATKMSGLLVLKSSGLTGQGYLDFDEAKISSKMMKFTANEMNADTAAMEIKSLGGAEVSFKAPNVKTKMNFTDKIGDFKSNEKDIATTFANNRFQAEINEFQWDMTKKILTFKSKEGTKGSRFVSTDPLKDSLEFYPKVAVYDMTKSIISMTGVEDFNIADSKVIPDEGKVTILPKGKIMTLQNAVIEGDTANYYHAFNNVTLDVHRKYDVIGRGEYTLKVNNTDYPIKIKEIKTTKVIVNPQAKEKHQIVSTTIEGVGKVDKAEELKIYRNTDFHGKVHIFMNKKYPHFEGEQRIRFENPRYKTPWFAVNNEINVDQLELYKEEIESNAGEKLYSGILIDRENPDGIAAGIYTKVMGKKKSELDQVGFDARGTIKHNKGTSMYTFGDSAKVKDESLKGNLMEYNDSAGTVHFSGTFNPQLGIGGIPLLMAGYMDNDIEANKYEFHGGIGMTIKMDPKVLSIIANFISQEFGLDKDIKYAKKENKIAMTELFHKKDLATFKKDIETALVIQNPPKHSSINFFFPEMHMDYDATDVTFRSKPKIGLGIIAGVPVNKIVKGYFEIGYGEIYDYFNIYIISKSREWLYINYAEGILGVLSSNDMVNSSINMIEPRKRLIKRSSEEFYRYGIAGDYEASSFVKRMKKGGSYYAEDSKPVQTEEDKPKASEKELKDADELEVKSQEELKEAADKLQLEDAEKSELERLLKELEAEEQKLKEMKQKASEEAEDTKIEPTPDDIPDPEEVLKEEPVEKESEEEPEIDNSERKEVEEEVEKTEKPKPEKVKKSNSLFDAYF